MRTITILALLIVLNGPPAIALGFDLEVTIRSHVEDVIFGDPVYIEVKIVNRGKKVVVYPQPELLFNTLNIRLYDPESRLEIRLGGGTGLLGAVGTQKYFPQQEVKRYLTVFMPNLQATRNPFWVSYRDGGRIMVSVEYEIERHLILRSNSEILSIGERDSAEMDVLESWANRDVEVSGKGPSPGDLGLAFLRPLNRPQLAMVAAKIGPGELADVMELTLMLQAIYETRWDSRDALDRKLVDWLRKQVNIKRETLIARAREVALNKNLPSTVEAIDGIPISR